MHSRAYARGLTLGAAALSLLAGTTSASAQKAAALPAPESVFGFPVGADYKLFTYDQSIDYFKKLAAGNPRMKLITVGKTSYGKTWTAAIISSPANLARLEQLRQINQRIAHPEGLTDSAAKRLARSGLALALASGKLALAPGQVFALSLALMVGTIPFTAMGLMIGALCSGSAAPGFANLIYLPGCYLSGMFFPLPKSMYWQAPIWPQFHVEQFAMHMAGVGKMQFEPLGMALASMLGYTVLFAGVTIWRLARKG